jgi:N-acetylneuraminate synthase
MVFIIGEIGTNHNGSIDIAKKIIDAAVNTGFDAVKFQKKSVEKIYTKEFLDSFLESPWGTTQREMRLHREFSENEFKEIDQHCKKHKIVWFFSSWDIDSQISMRKFKTKFNKVASAMLVHEKLLEIIAEEGKPTFISTGMSTMKEIEKAVKIFRKYKCPFELMHSTSSYPMKPGEANLKMIPMLKRKFQCNVGYSGHEVGASVISTAAVMLGATSIERHLTLDRTFYGYDQASSLEPEGMRRLVRDIRLLDVVMGDGKKKIWDSERPNMKKLRQIFS